MNDSYQSKTRYLRLDSEKIKKAKSISIEKKYGGTKC